MNPGGSPVSGERKEKNAKFQGKRKQNGCAGVLRGEGTAEPRENPLQKLRTQLRKVNGWGTNRPFGQGAQVSSPYKGGGGVTGGGGRDQDRD